MDRRRFLAGGGALAALGVAGPFAGVARAGLNGEIRSGGGYRPLKPVADQRDGAVRLHLPAGFRYASFSVTGDRFSDGSAVPSRHDGMAAFRGPSDTAILIRNHEVNGPVGVFGAPVRAYDPAAGGGTSTLRVTRYGKVISSAPSLTGTQMNCSGGPMPWGAWVTCEETVNGPDVGNDFTGQDNSRLTQKHGYIFEVPIDGKASGPIRSAGRFAHESVAFDSFTGAVYLTEDNFAFASGFYRYLPPKNPLRAGRILDGGKLQMLAVRGAPGKDLSRGQHRGASYETTWVEIDDPDPTFIGTPVNDLAVQAVGNQGRAKGAAIFSGWRGRSTTTARSTSPPRRAARPRPATPRPAASATDAARCGRTRRGAGGSGSSTSRRVRPPSTCPTTSPPAPGAPWSSARTARVTTTCAASPAGVRSSTSPAWPPSRETPAPSSPARPSAPAGTPST